MQKLLYTIYKALFPFSIYYAKPTARIPQYINPIVEIKTRRKKIVLAHKIIIIKRPKS
jgi:hypothetical protein